MSFYSKTNYPKYIPLKGMNSVSKYRLDKGTLTYVRGHYNGNEFGSRTSRCRGAESPDSKQTTCVLFAITPTELKLSKPTLKYKR